MNYVPALRAVDGASLSLSLSLSLSSPLYDGLSFSFAMSSRRHSPALSRALALPLDVPHYDTLGPCDILRYVHVRFTIPSVHISGDILSCT